jgi:hypothetical protein
MPNRAAPILIGAVALVVLALGSAAAADRPGRDGPPGLGERNAAEADGYAAWGRPVRPHGRPVNGGPGYVGSDYGLGKPAYTGLGTRPDWGFSE